MTQQLSGDQEAANTELYDTQLQSHRSIEIFACVNIMHLLKPVRVEKMQVG